MIDLSSAFRAVVNALDDCGLGYVVVGSTAAAVWGVLRATRDIDVVTVIDPGNAEFVIRLAEMDDLYVPVEDAREAVARGGSFNVLHPSSGGKVDVFVRKPDDAFARSRLARRVSAELFGVSTWVATPEDVVLAKLVWRLDSRSEVQWRDCVEIAASHDLDVDYLRSWAATLSVAADLDELLEATAD